MGRSKTGEIIIKTKNKRKSITKTELFITFTTFIVVLIVTTVLGNMIVTKLPINKEYKIYKSKLDKLILDADADDRKLSIIEGAITEVETNSIKLMDNLRTSEEFEADILRINSDYVSVEVALATKDDQTFEDKVVYDNLEAGIYYIEISGRTQEGYEALGKILSNYSYKIEGESSMGADFVEKTKVVILTVLLKES